MYRIWIRALFDGKYETSVMTRLYVRKGNADRMASKLEKMYKGIGIPTECIVTECTVCGDENPWEVTA